MTNRPCSGLQRVYQSRDELAARTKPNPSDLEQGDRANDRDHHEEVQQHSAAAEAEHMRSGHDSAVEVFGRAVSLVNGSCNERAHPVVFLLILWIKLRFSINSRSSEVCLRKRHLSRRDRAHPWDGKCRFLSRV